MANETQFLAMLTIVKNGAQVSFPQSTKTLDMSGSNMVQQPQLIPTAGAALSLGLVTGVPAKLMLKNNSAGYGLATVAVAAGGTGYTVNDILTIPGGSGTVAAQAKVTSVAAGVITGLSIQTYGDYSQIPALTVSPTGGTGAGASINITFAASNVIVYGDAGFTQAQDTIKPGDFILRSPSSATLYLKPTNAPVTIFTVAGEA